MRTRETRKEGYEKMIVLGEKEGGRDGERDDRWSMLIQGGRDDRKVDVDSMREGRHKGQC